MYTYFGMILDTFVSDVVLTDDVAFFCFFLVTLIHPVFPISSVVSVSIPGTGTGNWIIVKLTSKAC